MLQICKDGLKIISSCNILLSVGIPVFSEDWLATRLVSPNLFLERSVPMPLLKKSYTSKDYWNLPDGQRAELIDGQFYNMAPPSRIHQEISYQISRFLGNYIESNGGKCRVYPAPFAVNLDADDKDWVEPDISVICDPNKLTDRGCSGAPDLIFEIVSPSSRRMDYNIKNALYAQSGIREYWIVDPVKERVTVYHYEDDAAPVIYTFTQNVPVGIYPGLTLRIADLIG